MEIFSKIIGLCFIIAACSPYHSFENDAGVTEALEGTDNFIYDVETPGGIKIKANGAALPDVVSIDTWFMESQECIGYATIERPTVVIADDLDDLCGNGSTGVVCTSYNPPIIGIQTTYANFAYQWKHEYIHYILFFNDYPDDMNRNHEPKELWNCQF